MPIFFKASSDDRALVETLSDALGRQAISDSDQRRSVARDMVSNLRSTSWIASTSGKPVDWLRVGIAFALLILLFGLAVWLGAIAQQKASDPLFRSFEFLFTATVALLGLEDVKHG